MLYLKTIFKINYIYIYLTRLKRTRRHQRFFCHTNRVYKVVLIIIINEMLYARRKQIKY